MGDDFITLEEAVELSGLHRNTLQRLLRRGTIRGHKMLWNNKTRWMVSIRSLRQYTDPIDGFLLDMPGPRIFLRKVEEDEDEKGKN